MRQFSVPHLAALAVLIAATGAAVAVARQARGPVVVALARALAVLVAAGWAAESIVDLANGTWTVKYDLPLQLTDAVSLTAVLALWTRRQALVELLYFWALTASLQATLTPDLAQSFPSIYYFTYFDYHVGAIVGACMLVFGCGQYPRPGAAWRAFAATLGFAAVAGAADLATGGNYMYLRDKPGHGSLLSLLGPWPWYLVATAVAGLAMLLVLQWIAGRASRHDPRTAPVRVAPTRAAPARGA